MNFVGVRRGTTKDVGNVSEAFVTAHLLRLGAAVLKPLGDNERFDLAVYHHARFHRVQVKTARMEDGYLNVPLYSQSSAGARGYLHEVDFVIAWSSEMDRPYIVRLLDLFDERGNSDGSRVGSRLYLRLSAPKNGQSVGVRLASDYELRDLTPFERQQSPKRLHRSAS